MSDQQVAHQSGEPPPEKRWRTTGEAVVTGLRIIAAAVALYGALKGGGLL